MSSEFPLNTYMGRSIRTDRYRFTRWVISKDPKKLGGMELYDHKNDPRENFNIANRPENAELVKRLTGQLIARWREALPPPAQNKKNSKR